MTPLQQAAQAVIDRWDAPLNKVHMGMEALRKALADEQAQAVEPVAWIGDSPSKGNGRRLFWSESAAYAYADKYEPLYLHPAPPAAQQALSLDLLERLSKTLTNLGYSTPEGGMEHFGARIESQLYNLCRGVDSILAQQVAVPYDQQAMELCPECGWKAIMPGEPCFVCNMENDAQQVAVLTDLEQYRMQIAGISTAALGYWSEGDEIHPDYDTPALRDVARLYVKYDQLFKEKEARRAQQVAVPDHKPDWSAA